MLAFKIGSDPEVFLRNSSGEVVSAVDIIPGTKYDPYKTLNGSIQWDNVLAEFNSLPSDSLQEFINNHKLVLSDLSEFIKPLDLNIDITASLAINEELLMDPRVLLAGCSPDYNAWKSRVTKGPAGFVANLSPDYQSTNIRAAGGHLHISFPQAVLNNKARLDMVKALDLLLGVPSVLLDKDITRRKFYGQAGSFRPKDTYLDDPYDGIEYRVLSNFWLGSEALMKFVYSGVERAVNNLESIAKIAQENRVSILSAINNSDKKLARQLIDKYVLV